MDSVFPDTATHHDREVAGIDVLLRGWQLSGIDDADMEARGIALFEGMYAALSVTVNPRDKK